MISIFRSPTALALIHRAWGRMNPDLPWWVGHTSRTPAHVRMVAVARLAQATAWALQDETWAPGRDRVQPPPTPWVEWAARHRRATTSAMALPPGVDVRLPGTLRRHAQDGGGYGGRILGHLASVVLDARWRPQRVAADAEASLCHASAIEALVEAADQDITDWTPVVQSLVRRGHLELPTEAMRYYGLVGEAAKERPTTSLAVEAAALEAAVLKAAEALKDLEHPTVATRQVGCTRVAYTPVDLSFAEVDREKAIWALHLYESPVLGATWSPIQEPNLIVGYTYISVYPEKGHIPWPCLYVGYAEDTEPGVLYVARPID